MNRKNHEWGARSVVPAIGSTEPQRETAPECLSTWLTIQQAADILGVAERTIYHYLRLGKLIGKGSGHTVISQESVAQFTTKAPGQPRTRVPRWRRAPERNAQKITLISVRPFPGQEKQFACLLDAMHEYNSHALQGTVARHWMRNQDDPGDITLILVWREESMPANEEREAALAALRAYLADVLDWDTAKMKEGCALLHA